MPTVNVLPWDENLKYPQHQKVKINSVTYDLFYRWNAQGEFPVLKIVKTSTAEILLIEQVVYLNPRDVKDPTTGEVLFTILPNVVTEEDLEIWVFWLEE